MSDSFALDVTEWADLARDFQRAASGMRPKLERIVTKTTFDTERDGMAFTPVDTGNLKNSWVTTVRPGLLLGETGPTAEYAGYVNDGTSTQAPNGFVDKAFAKNVGPFLAAVEKVAEVIT